MARAEKAAAVADIVESFNGSAGAVLTEYRGLTVKQLQELRRRSARTPTTPWSRTRSPSSRPLRSGCLA